MAETSADLIQAFNASAAAALRNPDTMLFLAAKYRVMLTGKVTPDEDKTELASILLNTAVRILDRIAEPSFLGALNNCGDLFKPAFDALTMPESLKILPARTADAIADIALRLSTKGETLNEDSFLNLASSDNPNPYAKFRSELLQLVHLAAGAAQVVRAEIDNRTISVETAKPMTASRPLQLTGTPQK